MHRVLAIECYGTSIGCKTMLYWSYDCSVFRLSVRGRGQMCIGDRVCDGMDGGMGGGMSDGVGV